MLAKTLNKQAVNPSEGNLFNFAALVMHLVPKNLVSWLVGVFFRIRFPGALHGLVVGGFARLFRIDMAEAEFPLSRYPSVEDLFTRKLKAGARPVHEKAKVVAPADGMLAKSGPVLKGMAVQAKGLDYDVYDLAGVRADSCSSPAAWFQTVYLAPHNYHRVHVPVDGRLTAVRYIPGQLWPVNVPFVVRIPRLFVRNERLVFDIEATGGGRVFVVMVGALNVGRMVTPFMPSFVANSFDRQFGPVPIDQPLEQPVEVRRGDELGTFMLGSTVVNVYDHAFMQGVSLTTVDEAVPVRMGEAFSREV